LLRHHRVKKQIRDRQKSGWSEIVFDHLLRRSDTGKQGNKEQRTAAVGKKASEEHAHHKTPNTGVVASASEQGIVTSLLSSCIMSPNGAIIMPGG
jgi:hypothetical protein